MSDLDLLMRRLIDSGIHPLASVENARNLSGDGLITAALLAEAFGSNATLYVDEFLNSGVWTKRKNAALVFVEGLGAGQGGAQAYAVRATNFVSSQGGDGGAGGEWCEAMFFANELPEIVNVEIGAKGIGARYNNNTVVSARTPGGDTKFGRFLTASGGGLPSTVNGMLRETSSGANGGDYSTSGATRNITAASGRKTGKAGGGGGGGAAQTSGNFGGNGGVRTSTAVRSGELPAPDDNPPPGGTVDNTPGADGVRLGDGGGGGARGTTSAGTRGGNGARGGGGGGGGAPTFPSGSNTNYGNQGGDGGDGWLRVTTIVLRRS